MAPFRRGKAPAAKEGTMRRKVPLWVPIVIGLLCVLLLLLGSGLWYHQTNILSGPRINILLLGSDTDEKFAGRPLAQTDIVLTIDPATRTVGMLSIPRDFFLNVPGYGMHKLDEAYGLGGVALSRLTIEDDFGIPLNYYAWVGLDGFINVVNTLGGVDVNVTHPIVDDSYPDDIHSMNPYALERLYLPAGPQHLSGEEALEYVRSRHADLVGDFGRSARQQQVLTALKSKLDTPAIFEKLSPIANALNGSVKTDMQLTDIRLLMVFANGVNTNAIQKLVLSPPYSHLGTAPADAGVDANQSVVLPQCSAIVPALQKLFQLRSAICHIEGGPGVASSAASRQPVVASTSLANQPSSLADAAASGALPCLGRVAGNAVTGLLEGPSDLFGMRSLLALMLLVVFESPDVLQVEKR